MYILCLAHKQLLLYFKDFLLVFGCLRFEYDMARYKLFGIYPSYVSWTAWIHGLVSVISCGKFSVIVMSIIFFSAPFSPSLLIVPSCVCYMFYNYLTVFGYYVPFFLFAFQFWEVSIGISFSSLVPCLSMDSLLMSSSKAFFISVIELLISIISFWFFLRVSISLFMILIWSCMLSIFFPIEPLAYQSQLF